MAGPPATTSLTFTTRRVPAPSRRAVLHTLVEQGLLPVEPLAGHAAPEVDLVKWRLPGASILDGRFAGVRQRGTPEVGGAGDDLFFGINVTGAGRVDQDRRQVTVGAGDAMAVDLRAGAFTVLRPTRSRMIGVRVPRRALAVDGPAPRLVPGGTPALRLLTRYLRSVLDGPAPSSPPLADALVRHVSDLIALSLAPADRDTRLARAPGVRAARLHAIKSDIERHLTDGSLTAAVVAARHGISTRYLHRLFEDDAETYSRFVLGRRLDLAYRRLRDPRYADRTISSIANDTGFGDLSYFNRTFRRGYDTTPSEARRAAR
jgi:AraC-like DNA-binding protein